MTWIEGPHCCMCDHLMKTNYGPLGPHYCRLEPSKGEIGIYVPVSPEDGTPLNPLVDKPHPEWCPRVKEGKREEA